MVDYPFLKNIIWQSFQLKRQYFLFDTKISLQCRYINMLYTHSDFRYVEFKASFYNSFEVDQDESYYFFLSLFFIHLPVGKTKNASVPILSWKIAKHWKTDFSPRDIQRILYNSKRINFQFKIFVCSRTQNLLIKHFIVFNTI